MLPDKAGETPVGKFVADPIPVAPVVACVIIGSKVLIHKIGVILAAAAVVATAFNIIHRVDVLV